MQAVVLVAACGAAGGSLGGNSSTSLECSPPPPSVRFYLLDLPIAKRCRRPGLLAALQALGRRPSGGDLAQHLGPELFLHQHLASHPWRTRDPDTADLFVAPSLLAFALHDGLCDGLRGDEVIAALTEELTSSPHYARAGGADHLLVFTHWRARHRMFLLEPGHQPRTHNASVYSAFATATRRFILGHVMRSGALCRRRFMHWAAPSAAVLTVPYLVPSVLPSCAASPSGDDSMPETVACDAGDQGEASFAEYRAARNHTLFFVGNTLRAETAPAKAAALHVCHPTEMAGCQLAAMSGKSVDAMMRGSLFSVHVRGDSAGSSRVEAAVASGTPQIFLAGRYEAEVAAFPCKVPWGDMVLGLDHDAFLAQPETTVREALRVLIGGHGQGHGNRWRGMWRLQQEARRDLLWHVEGSRVGHNILLDAGRLLRRQAPRSQPLLRQAEEG
eukprot:jgi/Tetstr1/457248/TSEL_004177.t1